MKSAWVALRARNKQFIAYSQSEPLLYNATLQKSHTKFMSGCFAQLRESCWWMKAQSNVAQLQLPMLCTPLFSAHSFVHRFTHKDTSPVEKHEDETTNCIINSVFFLSFMTRCVINLMDRNFTNFSSNTHINSDTLRRDAHKEASSFMVNHFCGTLKLSCWANLACAVGVSLAEDSAKRALQVQIAESLMWYNSNNCENQWTDRNKEFGRVTSRHCSSSKLWNNCMRPPNLEEQLLRKLHKFKRSSN